MARPLPKKFPARDKVTVSRRQSLLEPDPASRDGAPNGVLRLRIHSRIATKIRAVLYTGATFQAVTIRDISRGGAGLKNCGSLHEDDTVTISLLTGRKIKARVKWWLGGVCGVQFLEPLPEDDALLTGRMEYSGASKLS